MHNQHENNHRNFTCIVAVCLVVTICIFVLAVCKVFNLSILQEPAIKLMRLPNATSTLQHDDTFYTAIALVIALFSVLITVVVFIAIYISTINVEKYRKEVQEDIKREKNALKQTVKDEKARIKQDRIVFVNSNTQTKNEIQDLIDKAREELKSEIDKAREELKSKMKSFTKASQVK